MNGDFDQAMAQIETASDLRQRFQVILNLSKRGVDPIAFYEAFLEGIIKDVPAHLAAIRQGGDGRTRVIASRGRANSASLLEETSWVTGAIPEAWGRGNAGKCCRRDHQGLTALTVAIVAEPQTTMQVVIPTERLSRDSVARNRGRNVSYGQNVSGNLPLSGQVSQVVDPPAKGAESVEGASGEICEIIEAYGQLCEDYERNAMLNRARSEVARYRGIDRVYQSLHRSLDIDRTGYEIVATVVAMTNASRASLLVKDRGELKVVAVSGVATIDHRSPPMRLLRELATAVDRCGQTLTYGETETGNGRSAPGDVLIQDSPQVSRPLDAYLDWSHAQSLVVMPLRLPDQGIETDDWDAGGQETDGSCGVLVVETLVPTRVVAIRDTVQPWIGQFRIAIGNSIRHSTLPTRRLGEAITRLSAVSPLRKGRWGVVGLFVVILAAAILVFVPAPLKIEAPGELRPAEIFNAFAPRDGYISEVFADHDERVSPGKQLLQLESPDLELELRRTEGAIESTEMELRAAEAARRRGNQPASAPRDDPGGFAANETRLQAVLESYLAQRELLRDEQRALKLVSPLDGYVLTWQPRQNLLGRPVQRGQRLMQIAATNSRWTLVLELADHDAGHVVAARNDLKADLPVTYNLATEPRKRLSGSIAEMSAVTEVSEKGTPMVEVVVAIDRNDLAIPRAGAQVRATIHCGNRPLGYVLFYRFWDAIVSFVA
jgi:hypothetical protein